MNNFRNVKPLTHNTIYNALIKFKPAGCYKGFRQLISTIEIIIENDYICYSLNRDIYPFVAQMYNCGLPTIERNIRTLMLNMDMNNLFSLTGMRPTENLTVKELIDSLVTYLRVSL